ncbi:MAG: GGDEF domain-containing protein [Anaerolineae bacterium]
MNDPKDTQGTVTVRPPRRNLVSALRWLARPLESRSEAMRRRANLLTWLLLFIFLLVVGALALVIIVDASSTPRRNAYLGLISLLAVLVTLALVLIRTGRFYASAGLTIACAVLGPWGSIAVDPAVIRGDIIPLVYVVVSILLSGILLPPLVTFAVALVQLVALALVPLIEPSTASYNWPSLLAFVVMASVLGILDSIIRQRDLEQIDEKTQLLQESEALLRDQSVRDHLTGLFNRRYLDETLEREIRRAARMEHPLGVIMMDIDHFRLFNEAKGHAAGDTVLKALGELLRQQIRFSDIACRYGGEEFVLILPDASLAVTGERAEHLRVMARDLHLVHQGQNLGKVTLSLGVAVFPDHGTTGEDILRAADAALYRAKSEGRDRVVVAA